MCLTISRGYNQSSIQIHILPLSSRLNLFGNKSIAKSKKRGEGRELYT
jgi:hypothetical protein